MKCSSAASTGVLLILAGMAGAARGAVTLPPLFSDHMLLQREARVPIWGTASNGEIVTVRFQDQAASTVASGASWTVYLDNLTTGGPFQMVVSGDNVTTIGDVLVGDVWVCSGQSNMLRALDTCDTSQTAIADSGNHPLRLFQILNGQTPDDGIWELSNPVTVPDFSGVAFFFGRALADHLGVPQGLIQSAVGGTSVTRWWNDPGLPGSGDLYNKMIAPLQPLAIRGVIWYQGEADSTNAIAPFYRQRFAGLIGQWRADWGQGSFPFLYVQLPRHVGGATLNPGKCSFARPNCKPCPFQTRLWPVPLI